MGVAVVYDVACLSVCLFAISLAVGVGGLVWLMDRYSYEIMIWSGYWTRMSSPLLLSCPIQYSGGTVFPPSLPFPPASRVCSFLRPSLVTRTLSAAMHPIVSLEPSDSFRSEKKKGKKGALALCSIFVLGFCDVSVFFRVFRSCLEHRMYVCMKAVAPNLGEIPQEQRDGVYTVCGACVVCVWGVCVCGWPVCML